MIAAGRRRRPLFDLGLGEILLIGVVILVFVGPDRIPELMSVAGRYYAKLRRLSDDLRRAFNAEVARVEADKRRDELEGRRKDAEAKLAAQRAEREANARAAAEQESANPSRPMPE
ncbi:MAG: twin-arginine translocase TatA/TatE family subunit, partial [Deltaproteobacteria bacterium]|nr:twin-arginine translocase TatA/TatE family subunit [Deltaproteobacteria bacterium]